jgi:glycosyltransferase involved in cell wall biosynthesis
MPIVSIIVPCLNEEKTIIRLLDALYHQTYPISEMEVIISDGNSQDRTLDKIQEWHDAHPDLALQIVSNPKRIIPPHQFRIGGVKWNLYHSSRRSFHSGSGLY